MIVLPHWLQVRLELDGERRKGRREVERNARHTADDARRQRGDLRSIARDLSVLAEAMIFSRLDDRSGALERRLRELTASKLSQLAMVATLLEDGTLGAFVGDELRGVAEASGPVRLRVPHLVHSHKALKYIKLDR